MKRLAVLISGNGSNLQALIDACADGQIAGQISLVVSNKPDAYGLTRAERAGIETISLPRSSGQSREDYDLQLAHLTSKTLPDLIILAGWMHVLGKTFLDRFPHQVINLHPALPGAFPGTHAIERAHQAFARGEISETGVMVHEVVPEIDAGPVLGSVRVPIHQGDSLANLVARVHAAEHGLLVNVVRNACA